MQYRPRIQHASFAALDDGLLLAQMRTGAALSQLIWFDRSGKNLGALGDAAQLGNVVLSPDGKTAATDRIEIGGQNTDVWLVDLQTGGGKRMTFDPAIDAMPVWDTAAKQFAFSSNRNFTFDIFLKPTDGREQEASFLAGSPDRFPNDWSHDGKYLLYERGVDIYYAAPPDRTEKEFLQGGSAVVKNARFSPDGKWVAYSSNESGKWEVYVTSFPEAKGKWQISNGGGVQPRWRADGKELYFLSSDAKMMAVPTSEGSNFDAGTPVALFQANPREFIATSEHNAYDVSKDGSRFLIDTALKSSDPQPMTVILNWAAKFKN